MRRIQRFTPNQLDPRVWAEIEDLVRETVTATNPPTAQAATNLSTVVAQLAAWAYGVGLDVQPHVIFHPDTIDRWLAEGLAHKSSGTRTNYRTRVRKVGEAVLGRQLYPPTPLPVRTSDPATPYSGGELSEIGSAIRGLRTPHQRAGAFALLTLCAGAGLTAAEVNEVSTDDVDTAYGGLLIRVVGDRARCVPVWRHYETAVERLVRDAEGGRLFLPRQPTLGVRRISRFQENLPPMDAPKLSVQRLRVTWIVRHLGDGVPLNVLADAAGVTPEQLAKYSAHLRPVDANTACRFLQGTLE